jgi:hypothetical protein
MFYLSLKIFLSEDSKIRILILVIYFKVMKIGIYELKAKKGVIRTTVKYYGDSLDIKITGDFMIFPEDVIFDLEKKLQGLSLNDLQNLPKILEETLSKATLFGCTIEDFKNSIYGALREVGL